jgi:vancomycin permeability regulator SanA
MIYLLLKKIIKITISLFIIIFALTVIIIVTDGLIDNVKKSDVIVILGNKVELDGSPSPRLKSRLDKGLELYKKNLAPLVIVSGGTGVEGYDEALTMKNYLINQGIPSENIIQDSAGIDSFNTARNAKKIISEMKLSSALVVSNYYHISRTRLAFNKLGVEKVYSAHADYFETRDFYSIAREVAGYYYHLIR